MCKKNTREILTGRRVRDDKNLFATAIHLFSFLNVASFPKQAQFKKPCRRQHKFPLRNGYTAVAWRAFGRLPLTAKQHVWNKYLGQELMFENNCGTPGFYNSVIRKDVYDCLKQEEKRKDRLKEDIVMNYPISKVIKEGVMKGLTLGQIKHHNSIRILELNRWMNSNYATYKKWREEKKEKTKRDDWYFKYNLHLNDLRKRRNLDARIQAAKIKKAENLAMIQKLRRENHIAYLERQAKREQRQKEKEERHRIKDQKVAEWETSRLMRIDTTDIRKFSVEEHRAYLRREKRREQLRQQQERTTVEYQKNLNECLKRGENWAKEVLSKNKAFQEKLRRAGQATKKSDAAVTRPNMRSNRMVLYIKPDCRGAPEAYWQELYVEKPVEVSIGGDSVGTKTTHVQAARVVLPKQEIQKRDLKSKRKEKKQKALNLNKVANREHVNKQPKFLTNMPADFRIQEDGSVVSAKTKVMHSKLTNNDDYDRMHKYGDWLCTEVINTPMSSGDKLLVGDFPVNVAPEKVLLVAEEPERNVLWECATFSATKNFMSGAPVFANGKLVSVITKSVTKKPTRGLYALSNYSCRSMAFDKNAPIHIKYKTMPMVCGDKEFENRSELLAYKRLKKMPNGTYVWFKEPNGIQLSLCYNGVELCNMHLNDWNNAICDAEHVPVMDIAYEFLNLTNCRLNFSLLFLQSLKEKYPLDFLKEASSYQCEDSNLSKLIKVLTNQDFCVDVIAEVINELTSSTSTDNEQTWESVYMILVGSLSAVSLITIFKVCRAVIRRRNYRYVRVQTQECVVDDYPKRFLTYVEDNSKNTLCEMSERPKQKYVEMPDGWELKGKTVVNAEINSFVYHSEANKDEYPRISSDWYTEEFPKNKEIGLLYVGNENYIYKKSGSKILSLTYDDQNIYMNICDSFVSPLNFISGTPIFSEDDHSLLSVITVSRFEKELFEYAITNADSPFLIFSKSSRVVLSHGTKTMLLSEGTGGDEVLIFAEEKSLRVITRNRGEKISDVRYQSGFNTISNNYHNNKVVSLITILTLAGQVHTKNVQRPIKCAVFDSKKFFMKSDKAPLFISLNINDNEVTEAITKIRDTLYDGTPVYTEDDMYNRLGKHFKECHDQIIRSMETYYSWLGEWGSDCAAACNSCDIGDMSNAKDSVVNAHVYSRWLSKWEMVEFCKNYEEYLKKFYDQFSNITFDFNDEQSWPVQILEKDYTSWIFKAQPTFERRQAMYVPRLQNIFDSKANVTKLGELHEYAMVSMEALSKFVSENLESCMQSCYCPCPKPNIEFEGFNDLFKNWTIMYNKKQECQKPVEEGHEYITMYDEHQLSAYQEHLKSKFDDFLKNITETAVNAKKVQVTTEELTEIFKKISPTFKQAYSLPGEKTMAELKKEYSVTQSWHEAYMEAHTKIKETMEMIQNIDTDSVNHIKSVLDEMAKDILRYDEKIKEVVNEYAVFIQKFQRLLDENEKINIAIKESTDNFDLMVIALKELARQAKELFTLANSKIPKMQQEMKNIVSSHSRKKRDLNPVTYLSALKQKAEANAAYKKVVNYIGKIKEMLEQLQSPHYTKDHKIESVREILKSVDGEVQMPRILNCLGTEIKIKMIEPTGPGCTLAPPEPEKEKQKDDSERKNETLLSKIEKQSKKSAFSERPYCPIQYKIDFDDRLKVTYFNNSGVNSCDAVSQAGVKCFMKEIAPYMMTVGHVACKRCLDSETISVESDGLFHCPGEVEKEIEMVKMDKESKLRVKMHNILIIISSFLSSLFVFERHGLVTAVVWACLTMNLATVYACDLDATVYKMQEVEDGKYKDVYATRGKFVVGSCIQTEYAMMTVLSIVTSHTYIPKGRALYDWTWETKHEYTCPLGWTKYSPCTTDHNDKTVGLFEEMTASNNEAFAGTSCALAGPVEMKHCLFVFEKKSGQLYETNANAVQTVVTLAVKYYDGSDKILEVKDGEVIENFGFKIVDFRMPQRPVPDAYIHGDRNYIVSGVNTIRYCVMNTTNQIDSFSDCPSHTVTQGAATVNYKLQQSDNLANYTMTLTNMYPDLHNGKDGELHAMEDHFIGTIQSTDVPNVQKYERCEMIRVSIMNSTEGISKNYKYAIALIKVEVKNTKACKFQVDCNPCTTNKPIFNLAVKENPVLNISILCGTFVSRTCNFTGVGEPLVLDVSSMQFRNPHYDFHMGVDTLMVKLHDGFNILDPLEKIGKIGEGLFKKIGSMFDFSKITKTVLAAAGIAFALLAATQGNYIFAALLSLAVAGLFMQPVAAENGYAIIEPQPLSENMHKILFYTCIVLYVATNFENLIAMTVTSIFLSVYVDEIVYYIGVIISAFSQQTAIFKQMIASDYETVLMRVDLSIDLCVVVAICFVELDFLLLAYVVIKHYTVLQTLFYTWASGVRFYVGKQHWAVSVIVAEAWPKLEKTKKNMVNSPLPFGTLPSTRLDSTSIFEHATSKVHLSELTEEGLNVNHMGMFYYSNVGGVLIVPRHCIEVPFGNQVVDIVGEDMIITSSNSKGGSYNIKPSKKRWEPGMSGFVYQLSGTLYMHRGVIEDKPVDCEQSIDEVSLHMDKKRTGTKSKVAQKSQSSQQKPVAKNKNHSVLNQVLRQTGKNTFVATNDTTVLHLGGRKYEVSSLNRTVVVDNSKISDLKKESERIRKQEYSHIIGGFLNQLATRRGLTIKVAPGDKVRDTIQRTFKNDQVAIVEIEKWCKSKQGQSLWIAAEQHCLRVKQQNFQISQKLEKTAELMKKCNIKEHVGRGRSSKLEPLPSTSNNVLISNMNFVRQLPRGSQVQPHADRDSSSVRRVTRVVTPIEDDEEIVDEPHTSESESEASEPTMSTIDNLISSFEAAGRTLTDMQKNALKDMETLQFNFERLRKAFGWPESDEYAQQISDVYYNIAYFSAKDRNVQLTAVTVDERAGLPEERPAVEENIEIGLLSLLSGPVMETEREIDLWKAVSAKMKSIPGRDNLYKTQNRRVINKIVKLEEEVSPKITDMEFILEKIYEVEGAAKIQEKYPLALHKGQILRHPSDTWLQTHTTLATMYLNRVGAGVMFLHKGTITSSCHITQTNDISINYYSDDKGLSISTDNRDEVKTAIFKIKTCLKPTEGDFTQFTVDDSEPNVLKSPEVSNIYFLVDHKRMRWCTLLCKAVGSINPVPNQAKILQNNFVIVDITQSDRIGNPKIIQSYDVLKGLSGSPILDSQCKPVGMFGNSVMHGRNVNTGHHVVVTPTFANVGSSKLAAEATAILTKMRQQSPGKMVLVCGGTGCGKTTKLVLALSKKFYEQNGSRRITVYVAVPQKAVVDSIFEYMKSSINMSPKDASFIEIQKKHGDTQLTSSSNVVDSGQVIILYATYNTILRMMLDDAPSLLILDEVHTVGNSLALQELVRVWSSRKEVVAMTATPWDSEIWDVYSLPDQGRKFSVRMHKISTVNWNQPKKSDSKKGSGAQVPTVEAGKIPIQLRKGVVYMLNGNDIVENSNAIVFLPTPKACKEAREVAKDYTTKMCEVVHGGTSRDVTFSNAIIFATNAIESGITVPHVSCIVDFRLENVCYVDIGTNEYDRVVSFTETMRIVPITKQSALQRAGRGGRTCETKIFYVDEKLRDFDPMPTHACMTAAFDLASIPDLSANIGYGHPQISPIYELIKPELVCVRYGESEKRYTKEERPHLYTHIYGCPIPKVPENTMLSITTNVDLPREYWRMKLELATYFRYNPMILYLLPAIPKSWKDPSLASHFFRTQPGETVVPKKALELLHELDFRFSILKPMEDVVKLMDASKNKNVVQISSSKLQDILDPPPDIISGVNAETQYVKYVSSKFEQKQYSSFEGGLGYAILASVGAAIAASQVWARYCADTRPNEAYIFKSNNLFREISGYKYMREEDYYKKDTILANRFIRSLKEQGAEFKQSVVNIVNRTMTHVGTEMPQTTRNRASEVWRSMQDVQRRARQRVAHAISVSQARSAAYFTRRRTRPQYQQDERQEDIPTDQSTENAPLIEEETYGSQFSIQDIDWDKIWQDIKEFFESIYEKIRNIDWNNIKELEKYLDKICYGATGLMTTFFSTVVENFGEVAATVLLTLLSAYAAHCSSMVGYIALTTFSSIAYMIKNALFRGRNDEFLGGNIITSFVLGPLVERILAPYFYEEDVTGALKHALSIGTKEVGSSALAAAAVLSDRMTIPQKLGWTGDAAAGFLIARNLVAMIDKGGIELTWPQKLSKGLSILLAARSVSKLGLKGYMCSIVTVGSYALVKRLRAKLKNAHVDRFSQAKAVDKGTPSPIDIATEIMLGEDSMLETIYDLVMTFCGSLANPAGIPAACMSVASIYYSMENPKEVSYKNWIKHVSMAIAEDPLILILSSAYQIFNTYKTNKEQEGVAQMLNYGSLPEFVSSIEERVRSIFKNIVSFIKQLTSNPGEYVIRCAATMYKWAILLKEHIAHALGGLYENITDTISKKMLTTVFPLWFIEWFRSSPKPLKNPLEDDADYTTMSTRKIQKAVLFFGFGEYLNQLTHLKIFGSKWPEVRMITSPCNINEMRQLSNFVRFPINEDEKCIRDALREVKNVVRAVKFVDRSNRSKVILMASRVLGNLLSKDPARMIEEESFYATVAQHNVLMSEKDGVNTTLMINKNENQFVLIIVSLHKDDQSSIVITNVKAAMLSFSGIGMTEVTVVSMDKLQKIYEELDDLIVKDSCTYLKTTNNSLLPIPEVKNYGLIMKYVSLSTLELSEKNIRSLLALVLNAGKWDVEVAKRENLADKVEYIVENILGQPFRIRLSRLSGKANDESIYKFLSVKTTVVQENRRDPLKYRERIAGARMVELKCVRSHEALSYVISMIVRPATHEYFAVWLSWLTGQKVHYEDKMVSVLVETPYSCPDCTVYYNDEYAYIEYLNCSLHGREGLRDIEVDYHCRSVPRITFDSSRNLKHRFESLFNRDKSSHTFVKRPWYNKEKYVLGKPTEISKYVFENHLQHTIEDVKDKIKVIQENFTCAQKQSKLNSLFLYIKRCGGDAMFEEPDFSIPVELIIDGSIRPTIEVTVEYTAGLSCLSDYKTIREILRQGLTQEETNFYLIDNSEKKYYYILPLHYCILSRIRLEKKYVLVQAPGLTIESMISEYMLLNKEGIEDQSSLEELVLSHTGFLLEKRTRELTDTRNSWCVDYEDLATLSDLRHIASATPRELKNITGGHKEVKEIIDATFGKVLAEFVHKYAQRQNTNKLGRIVQSVYSPTDYVSFRNVENKDVLKVITSKIYTQDQKLEKLNKMLDKDNSIRTKVGKALQGLMKKCSEEESDLHEKQIQDSSPMNSTSTSRSLSEPFTFLPKSTRKSIQAKKSALRLLRKMWSFGELATEKAGRVEEFVNGKSGGGSERLLETKTYNADSMLTSFLKSLSFTPRNLVRQQEYHRIPNNNEVIANDVTITAPAQNKVYLEQEFESPPSHITEFVIHFDQITNRVFDKECYSINKWNPAKNVETRYHKSIPVGKPIRWLLRTTRLPAAAQHAPHNMQMAVNKMTHIQGKEWEVMKRQGRVELPTIFDNAIASRGYYKAALMDYDLGIFSKSRVIVDLSAGYGGFVQYAASCINKTNTKEIFVNTLKLQGHASPVMDLIYQSRYSDKVRIARLQPKCNGDIRYREVYDLVKENAEPAQIDLIVSDCGESNVILSTEAKWMISPRTIQGVDKDNIKHRTIATTYADALSEYLKMLAPGGSAIIKMMGFANVTVELCHQYSRYFSKALAWKAPTASFQSREWYLILTGFNPKLIGKSSDIQQFPFHNMVNHMQNIWYDEFNKHREWCYKNLEGVRKALSHKKLYRVPMYQVQVMNPISKLPVRISYEEQLRVVETTAIRPKIDEQFGIPLNFTFKGVEFKSQLPARFELLKEEIKKKNYGIEGPTGHFKVAKELGRVKFKMHPGNEKSNANMVMRDMAYNVFGLNAENSVIGTTQATEEKLYTAWTKRLDILPQEPSAADAELLWQAHLAQKTAAYRKIANGPDQKKI
ncbi:MAG: polyprotein [Hangzhou flavivirus 2]|nr:MAG: polyprotein [Hangzhou flavivirus 2]